MHPSLAIAAIAVPLAALALYLALLVRGGRAEDVRRRRLEEWQREHRPRVVERRLRERRTPRPPRSLHDRSGR